MSRVTPMPELLAEVEELARGIPRADPDQVQLVLERVAVCREDLEMYPGNRVIALCVREWAVGKRGMLREIKESRERGDYDRERDLWDWF